jgi:biopolymer transport protein ExbD
MPFKREEEKERPVEFVPLIDVVFNVLLFFLVATTFGEIIRSPQEISIDLPSVRAGKAPATLRIDIGYNSSSQELEYYLFHLNLNPSAHIKWGAHYSDLEWNGWPRIVNRNAAVTDYSQPVGMECVKKRIKDLKRLLAQRGREPKIVIRGEENMPYYPVIELIGLCKNEGLHRVSFVTGNVRTQNE